MLPRLNRLAKFENFFSGKGNFFRFWGIFFFKIPEVSEMPEMRENPEVS